MRKSRSFAPSLPRCRPRSTGWTADAMLGRLFAALTALFAAAVAASAQTVGIAPAMDFSTARVALGAWAYQAVPGGSTARFVDTTGTARLVLQCTRTTRRVT